MDIGVGNKLLKLNFKIVEEATGGRGTMPFESTLFLGLNIERPLQHGGDINGREVKSLFEDDDLNHTLVNGSPALPLRAAGFLRRTAR